MDLGTAQRKPEFDHLGFSKGAFEGKMKEAGRNFGRKASASL